MLSARDIREFSSFLRNATDRQVQGIYDKEKRAGRDDYAELAVAEAKRRDIELDEIGHSTKKKSRAQLDREIAAALGGGTRRSHATTMRAVPGVAKWSMTAGGTGAARDKHGYTFTVPEGTYRIWPFTTKFGRHAGYALKFSAEGGGRPRGSHGGLWHDLGTHRSPQSAASAAAKHHAGGFE